MRKISTSLLSIAFLPMLSAAPASASLVEQFICDAGDMSYIVNISPLQPGVANVDVSVSEMMDQSVARQFLLNRTNPASGVAFSGSDARLGTVTFTAQDMDSGQLKFGRDVLTCTYSGLGEEPDEDSFENRMKREMEQSERRNRLTPVNRPAKSLGGNLRKGPDRSYKKLDHIEYGLPVEILDRSGVVLDGYPYFKVYAEGQTGFMKGKHICSMDRKVDGVKRVCKDWDRPFSERSSGGYSRASNDEASWMVFAIDETGKYGHGVHPDINRARDYALDYCGQGCRVVAETRSNCHAFAQSRKSGYWYGIADGNNRYAQRAAAVGFCQKRAPKNTCRVKYAYCQSDER